MTNFWRPEQPLEPQELNLIRAVFEAHQKSAFRDNMSTSMCITAALGSGRYANGIAGAILTLGAIHGPIEQCMEYLESEMRSRTPTLPPLVPGWGNSFIKGAPDEDWKEVDGIVKEMYPRLYEIIEDTTDTLHANGKAIYPNPGCYTAAACIILGIPKEIASYLFIAARLDCWTSLILHHMKPNLNGKEGVAPSAR